MSESQLLELARGASRGDSGDPLDEAIRRLSPPAAGAGDRWPCSPSPRDASAKRPSSRRSDGRLIAVTKGAGELVLAMTDLAADERRSWTERLVRYAGEGHKVIGCAWREVEDDWAGGEPDRGYRWAGLLAFEDPVREGVPEAVRQCRAAGIRVVMVTGDHPATAAAVARQIGLGADAARDHR